MLTRQTADTFLAAATFLELGQIWGPLDPEVASKIKYAKFHALRIVKALKAGEDPNHSNPRSPAQMQPTVEEDLHIPSPPVYDLTAEEGAASQEPSGPHSPDVEIQKLSPLQNQVSSIVPAVSAVSPISDLPLGTMSSHSAEAVVGAAAPNESAITEAQKHAKWAISALAFEDVPTAIKELRIALRELDSADT